MLIDELHAKKDFIEKTAAYYGANRIRVFGSVVRREEKPESDIDFLVNLPVGYDLFLQRLPLTEKLSELTGRRVDLTPEHELNPHLRPYIMEEAEYL